MGRVTEGAGNLETIGQLGNPYSPGGLSLVPRVLGCGSLTAVLVAAPQVHGLGEVRCDGAALISANAVNLYKRSPTGHVVRRELYSAVEAATVQKA